MSQSNKKVTFWRKKKNFSSPTIWIFSYLLTIAKHLASNRNNESRVSMLRGFHLNKQGNFHLKYMFCHASTEQKSGISHLMQIPSYPGSYTPPEKRKTISACSLLSTASFFVRPEVWLQCLNAKSAQLLVSILKSDWAYEFSDVAASQFLPSC